MKKKLLIVMLLSILSLSFFSFQTNATEISGAADYKWVKFIADIPEDIIFDYNIAIELLNEKNNQVTTYKLDKSDEYTSYQTLSYGTYSISNIKVVGEYEGYFNCGYSKDSFKISSSSEDITNIPFIIEFITKTSDSDGYSNDFDGMTFEEVMNLIENEATNSNDKKTENNPIEESNKTEVSEESNEKLTIEEAIEKEEKAQQKAEKQEQYKKENSILPSFIFMCLVLAGLGIAFFIYKKRNSV